MSEDKNQLICPACGSNQVDERTEERQLSFPYAGVFNFREVINHCRTCNTEGDFTQSNETTLSALEEQAKRAGAENILNYLTNEGYSMAYMERALDLPQRTMMRWKAGECAASSLVLLQMVRTFPWLLKVSEARFDSVKSIQILCNEGFKLVGEFILRANPDARVQVTVDSKQADQVIFTTSVTAKKDIDYSTYQQIQVAGGT